MASDSGLCALLSLHPRCSQELGQALGLGIVIKLKEIYCPVGEITPSFLGNGVVMFECITFSFRDFESVFKEIRIALWHYISRTFPQSSCMVKGTIFSDFLAIFYDYLVIVHCKNLKCR